MADTLGRKAGFLPLAFVGEDGVSYGFEHDGGKIKVIVDGITIGDIAIGAVELKNSDTDDRAKINTDGSLFTTNVPVAYDTKVVDEADPNNVTITYKLSGDTVATKTIAVSGTTTTITFALA